MPVYRIADVNFKISPQSGYCEQHLSAYSSEDNNYSYEVIVKDSDIEFEKSRVKDCSDGMYESAAILRRISKILSQNCGCFLLHSAAVKYNNKAYLFSAPSGTGKTTHIKLWKKLYGEKVQIINGDKPFVRNFGDKFIVYGSPWNGKENFGCNISAELGGIFIVNRSTDNKVTKLSVADALPKLMLQTPLSFEREDAEKMLAWFDGLLNAVPVFLLNCNMDSEAAEVAKACADKLI